MPSSGNISLLYHTFYSSRENQRDESAIRTLLSNASKQKNSPFDYSVIDRYINNPHFIEQEIIQYICNIKNVTLDVEYLSLYARNLNATAIRADQECAIFVDELLVYSCLTFFLTIYSYSYTKSHFKFHCKCLRALVEEQGQQHKIDLSRSYGLKFLKLPENVIHLAMDSYWVAWTFLIGHELYHLRSKSSTPSQEEEFAADRYGYSLVIQLMSLQKQGKIPAHLCVFYNYLYLVPVMLFKYFELVENCMQQCRQTISRTEHPAPKDREDQIFSMFDTKIPADFDTTVGNDLLNSFLDALESLEQGMYPTDEN